jgi:hypothetical protein
MIALWIILGLLGFAAIIVMLLSTYYIGPTEVGLVTKLVGGKLKESDPIAFSGEAGYQADLLMPGLRFKFKLLYTVRKIPWVQIPAGEIGVVIAQVGQPLPIGAKSAVYKKEFGDFRDLKGFIKSGGQKGVQRPALSPGTLAPIHPVGFMVLTRSKVYGVPVSPEHTDFQRKKGVLTVDAWGLSPDQFSLTRIEYTEGERIDYPKISEEQEKAKKREVQADKTLAREGERIADRVLRARKGIMDVVGIVTALEGDPLPPGDIASRLGGFRDIEERESGGAPDGEIIDLILSNKNQLHNNYQDFQAFLDNGGKMGLQHDPLLYGAYVLNPFLVRVEIVPMLVVEQGEVAVIKAYVGLSTKEASGEQFKFGSLVKPGHRGIWTETLRTGKYALNPHCYQAEIVPTSILTLNWAEKVSHAHYLDAQLSPIDAKSREGFIFRLDLQVQIHVAVEQASKVISMVGTMQNLVTEVLQAAVGNHFRDKLQSMPAVTFIETRQKVQEEAFKHIEGQLRQYQVETKGVYIQDVILPPQLVEVLTQREIANQEIETWKKKTLAQEQKQLTEKAIGRADKQRELASAEIEVDIKKNRAEARKKEADGEAYYVAETGRAKGAEVEAVGLARAKAYRAQMEALGPENTALVNAIIPLSENRLSFVPQVMVTGGNAMEGLAGTVMNYLLGGKKPSQPSSNPKTEGEKKES